MDSDEAVAIVTGRGMEAILRMHKGEEERVAGLLLGSFDIEGASKKGQQDGIEGVWQEGLVGLPGLEMVGLSNGVNNRHLY